MQLEFGEIIKVILDEDEIPEKVRGFDDCPIVEFIFMPTEKGRIDLDVYISMGVRKVFVDLWPIKESADKMNKVQKVLNEIMKDDFYWSQVRENYLETLEPEG